MKKPSLKFHYAWVIAFAGMLCTFSALGLGRFALGMLLPSMGKSLELSYTEMGIIGTGNFIGYLVSVLLSGHMSTRINPRKYIFGALLTVGITMMLISRSSGFAALLALYTITGVGSGAANIPMMGLASAWFAKAIRGRAAGYMVIGSGFAIIMSGQLIPAINSRYGAFGWRTGWMLLGIIVIIAAFVCHAIIRSRPDEMGLKPLGHDKTHERQAPHATDSVYKSGIIYHLGAIYFLFGFTYVIYATFFVTTLVSELGYAEPDAGAMWSWIGLLSLMSGPVFGSLSDRLGRKAGLAIVFSFQAVSYFLVASGADGLPLYISIILYGSVAWSIPSIMAAAVGDYLGAAKAAQAFGAITFIFALGQISGPAVAGIMADAAGSFKSSFAMAGAMSLSAIILALYLKKPGPR